MDAQRNLAASPMQVVSDPVWREKVHVAALPATALPTKTNASCHGATPRRRATASIELGLHTCGSSPCIRLAMAMAA